MHNTWTEQSQSNLALEDHQILHTGVAVATREETCNGCSADAYLSSGRVNDRDIRMGGIARSRVNITLVHKDIRLVHAGAGVLQLHLMVSESPYSCGIRESLSNIL